jgi:hypothetical protein
MRASKWHLQDAQKRIKATLEWRREFRPDLIPPDEVKIESETGKMYVPLSPLLPPFIGETNKSQLAS